MKKVICPSCHEDYDIDKCDNLFIFAREPLYIEQQRLETELRELGYRIIRCAFCGQTIICKTSED